MPRSPGKNEPTIRDRQNLRDALVKSSPTEHVIVPNWKQPENEQTDRLRRARLQPKGDK
jgi:hypothetical protein